MYFVFWLIAIVLFLYLSWKQLQEGYNSQQIIGFSWGLVLAMILIGRLTGGEWQSDSGWLILAIWRPLRVNYFVSLIIAVLLCAWMSRKNNWKLWSVLEDLTPAFLAFITFGLMADLCRAFTWKLLIDLAIAIMAVVWSRGLKSRYRSLVWYPSGKKGFVFLAISTISFALISISTFFLEDRHFFPYLYLGTSLISGWGLYMLGRR